MNETENPLIPRLRDAYSKMELHDWELLREAGAAITAAETRLVSVELELKELKEKPKDRAMRHYNETGSSEEMVRYDYIADAVTEVANAAAEAFEKAGIQPGEWDGDDIVKDVSRGIANDIERLRALGKE